MENLINKYHLSDNIEFLKQLPDNCLDSIITDSPYGLGKEPDAHKCILDWVEKGFHEVKGTGFMGKKWDAFVPQPILWKECYRVLKPGGHLLSFFGTRTYDWGTLAIRLGGFEIRDQIEWIYGSGFPKTKKHLKPAHEPICVARKPSKTNTDLNIDECRIDLNGDYKGGKANRTKGIGELQNETVYSKAKRAVHDNSVGRYPSNVILDEDTSVLIDEQSGISGGDKRKFKIDHGIQRGYKYIPSGEPIGTSVCYNDKGGASRFFYVAKASPSERKGMKHPTIKPVKLMMQLVKLYTPEGGIVLDPHFGSGSTGEAAINTNRRFIGIDNDPQSMSDADLRFERLGLFKMML